MKDSDGKTQTPEGRKEPAEGAQRKLSPYVERKIEEIKALARELDTYKPSSRSR